MEHQLKQIGSGFHCSCGVVYRESVEQNNWTKARVLQGDSMAEIYCPNMGKLSSYCGESLFRSEVGKMDRPT